MYDALGPLPYQGSAQRPSRVAIIATSRAGLKLGRAMESNGEPVQPKPALESAVAMLARSREYESLE